MSDWWDWEIVFLTQRGAEVRAENAEERRGGEEERRRGEGVL
jgi:hypothetical protein